MVVQIAPEGIKQAGPIACVVCREAVKLGGVCIGATDLTGRQAFACATHLAQQAKRSQWIVSWADSITGSNIPAVVGMS